MSLTESRTRRDELLRGFRAAPYAYDIVMDIGAYRDLHRHRRCQQFRQAYTSNLGFETPGAIAEAVLSELYNSVLSRSFTSRPSFRDPGRTICALRGARPIPFQDGLRRSRIHRTPAIRREGPLQLSQNSVANEGKNGAIGAGAGEAHGSDAARNRRSAAALVSACRHSRSVIAVKLSRPAHGPHR